ncbi:hypothetical protein ACFVH6_37845 [Spirillospora sp. NPDC127200]
MQDDVPDIVTPSKSDTPAGNNDGDRSTASACLTSPASAGGSTTIRTWLRQNAAAGKISNNPSDHGGTPNLLLNTAGL